MLKEPTALALSQFFSSLVGKPVQFSRAGSATDLKQPCMYAAYSVLPEKTSLVMGIGIKPLALLGAGLLGLPEETAVERASGAQEDEPMRDAMHEVLNIASTAIGGDTRIVFQSMHREEARLPGSCSVALRTPSLRCAFQIAVNGTKAEPVVIFAE